MLIGIRTFRRDMRFGTNDAMTPKTVCGSNQDEMDKKKTLGGRGAIRVLAAARNGTPN